MLFYSELTSMFAYSVHATSGFMLYFYIHTFNLIRHFFDLLCCYLTVSGSLAYFGQLEKGMLIFSVAFLLTVVLKITYRPIMAATFCMKFI